MLPGRRREDLVGDDECACTFRGWDMTYFMVGME